jgi:hypothetical protein
MVVIKPNREARRDASRAESPAKIFAQNKIGHEEGTDDQHAAPPNPIGAGREEQRHGGVSDQGQGQQRAVVRLAQPYADQIKDQHDGERAVRE